MKTVQTGRRNGAGRVCPTGITKKMFLAVIAFGLLLIGAVTSVLTVFSTRYLSRSLREQLDSQTRQILNIYDQQMEALGTAVITAYNQSSISALMSGLYTGYQAYTVSRDAYAYLCMINKINGYAQMYLFQPDKNYVLGSSYANVSSDFDIASAPTTAGWYGEIKDTFSTINIRGDFVPPVTGGDSCFAYIMTVHAASTWDVRGFIAGTLDKRFLDGLLTGTFFEDKGFLVITDAAGSVLYTSDQAMSEAHSDLIPPPAYFESRPAHAEDAGLKGYYMVSDLSRYGGFRLIAFADKSTVNSSVSRLQLIVLLVLGLALFLLLAGSYFISRSITRPVREITQFIHRLEKNNFNGRLTIDSDDEVGELARSFNAMLDSVQENQILRRQAQLSALQKQIDPHFLYNTLESVKALAIRQDTPAVCSMLQCLGDLFRYNTNRDNSSTTTIQNELRHVENYLKIQKMRFGARLCYRFEVDETLLQCVTLKFILQPLVENSLRYAMEAMENSYMLKVAVHPSGEGDILVEVADNGPGMPPERLAEIRSFLNEDGAQGDFGIGIKNIAQRLRLYFSEPYGLTIDSVPGEGTVVRIRMPKRSE